MIGVVSFEITLGTFGITFEPVACSELTVVRTSTSDLYVKRFVPALRTTRYDFFLFFVHSKLKTPQEEGCSIGNSVWAGDEGFHLFPFQIPFV